jgi:uncharacterized RDD family membrane protein YckC
MQIVFIPTIGGSIGHRLLGLRVVALTGGWVGLWRPVVRSVLLGIVVPALVWDSDQRGFHDKIAGTVIIRTKRREETVPAINDAGGESRGCCGFRRD